jgi:hypothetical protein
MGSVLAEGLQKFPYLLGWDPQFSRWAALSTPAPLYSTDLQTAIDLQIPIAASVLSRLSRVEVAVS